MKMLPKAKNLAAKQQKILTNGIPHDLVELTRKAIHTQ
jgi:hypothetical protein